jgi:hypothetical protein
MGNNAASLHRPGVARSAVWAAAITAPLMLWGSSNSMALAHVGGPLVLLFLPVVPVLLLFGSGGVFEGAPEWLFSVLAVVAQFAGTLLVVHAIRRALAKRRGNDT